MEKNSMTPQGGQQGKEVLARANMEYRRLRPMPPSPEQAREAIDGLIESLPAASVHSTIFCLCSKLYADRKKSSKKWADLLYERYASLPDESYASRYPKKRKRALGFDIGPWLVGTLFGPIAGAAAGTVLGGVLEPSFDDEDNEEERDARVSTPPPAQDLGTIPLTAVLDFCRQPWQLKTTVYQIYLFLLHLDQHDKPFLQAIDELRSILGSMPDDSLPATRPSVPRGEDCLRYVYYDTHPSLLLRLYAELNGIGWIQCRNSQAFVDIFSGQPASPVRWMENPSKLVMLVRALKEKKLIEVKGSIWKATANSFRDENGAHLRDLNRLHPPKSYALVIDRLTSLLLPTDPKRK